MIVQYLFLLLLIVRDIQSDHILNINGEIDSTISFPCEINQLPNNIVITWVYRPKISSIHGISWLPLYANGRRLTQNNPRFFVDYHGYNDRTKKHSSILTINQLKSSDEGLYKCRSNQYQSIPFIFNLTISPTMRIFPNDGILHLNHHDHSLNLSCTVRELSTVKINPFKLKWYHNNKEINSKYLKKKYFFDENQATLFLILDHFIRNNSDNFQCIYENGKITKHVQISTSVIDYSKSNSRRINDLVSSSYYYHLCVITVLFFIIN